MIVILLNPSHRPGTPATVEEITHRLAEISFSSPFCVELQGIALAKKEADRALISFGRLERRLRRLNLHLIDSHDFIGRRNLLSRLNTQPEFIKALRDWGRRCADRWLAANFRLIGTHSSFPAEALLFE